MLGASRTNCKKKTKKIAITCAKGEKTAQA
jgi:hypothetical protein